MKKILSNILKNTLLTMLFCLSIQPLVGAISAKKLFVYIKNSCVSTSENYYALAKLILRNSDHGTITDEAFAAIKLDLACSAFNKQQEGDFDIYEKTVLDFLTKDQASTKATTECSICLEKPKDFLVTLTCNHIFCYKCIFKWFVEHDPRKTEDVQRACPNCRQAIAMPIQKVFLRDPRATRRIQRNHIKRLREEEEMEEEMVEQYILHQLFGPILQTLAQNQEANDGEPITIFFLFILF